MNKPSFTTSAYSETQLAAASRRAEGWYTRYLTGTGLDLGCGPEPVAPNARGWDIANGDGDATALVGVAAASQNFVYASHLLEHLPEPRLALANWWRVLKPGGFLLLTVPEEDSYERGLWPSIRNSDHKSTWCAWTATSWSPNSYSMLALLRELPGAKLHSLRLMPYDEQWLSVEAVVEKQATQPVLQNTIVAGLVCMCGSDNLLFKGTNLAGNMTFKCLTCGQSTHCSLQEHAQLATKNIQILMERKHA